MYGIPITSVELTGGPLNNARASDLEYSSRWIWTGCSHHFGAKQAWAGSCGRSPATGGRRWSCHTPNVTPIQTRIHVQAG